MNKEDKEIKAIENISKILGYAFIFTVAIIIIATFVTLAEIFWNLVLKIF